jgi:hypothetical protein
MVNRLFCTACVLLMVFGIVFVSEVHAFGSAASFNQTSTVKRKTTKAAGKTYRGGRYVVRRTWNGTRYVSRRVWIKSKPVARKAESGTRWTAHKTKRGTKKVFRKAKDIVN